MAEVQKLLAGITIDLNNEDALSTFIYTLNKDKKNKNQFDLDLIDKVVCDITFFQNLIIQMGKESVYELYKEL